MSHQVFIALGTNLGDRPANLETALQALEPKVQIVARSPVYQTPPWGYQDQPDFLNQVVEGRTDLSPQELLVFLKQVESSMGRVKTVQDGPRIIDLDILFYDNRVLETPNLTIPHPRMEGRGFVLVPLADLAPDLLHPVFGLSVREMLSEADRSGIQLFQAD
jgi:2-amino-4-hydroxy-6-hydroxymethyldihydropteridine diphosphokinase